MLTNILMSATMMCEIASGMVCGIAPAFMRHSHSAETTTTLSLVRDTF